MLSEKEREQMQQVRKFFGEVEPSVMDGLLRNKAYEK